MAPIPAAWGQGQADLAREKGHPRRPRPAPSPELASRFSVEQGPGPPSRLSPSGFPSPDPSLLLVHGTAADTRRGPHPCTRGGVGLGSKVAPQAAHPSQTPRPACARSPHSLSEGRGRPTAVRALQRQELGTGRGGQLQGRRLMPEEDDPRQVREPLPQHGSGPPAPQSCIF